MEVTRVIDYGSSLRALIDNVEHLVPKNEKNRHYRAIVESGLEWESPDDLEPERWFIPMPIVTQRIIDAGLAEAAAIAIDADADMKLTWPQMPGVWNDDARVRAFIQGIGGDLDIILAVDG